MAQSNSKYFHAEFCPPAEYEHGLPNRISPQDLIEQQIYSLILRLDAGHNNTIRSVCDLRNCIRVGGALAVTMCLKNTDLTTAVEVDGSVSGASIWTPSPNLGFRISTGREMRPVVEGYMKNYSDGIDLESLDEHAGMDERQLVRVY